MPKLLQQTTKLEIWKFWKHALVGMKGILLDRRSCFNLWIITFIQIGEPYREDILYLKGVAIPFLHSYDDRFKPRLNTKKKHFTDNYGSMLEFFFELYDKSVVYNKKLDLGVCPIYHNFVASLCLLSMKVTIAMECLHLKKWINVGSSSFFVWTNMGFIRFLIKKKPNFE